MEKQIIIIGMYVFKYDLGKLKYKVNLFYLLFSVTHWSKKKYVSDSRNKKNYPENVKIGRKIQLFCRVRFGKMRCREKYFRFLSFFSPPPPLPTDDTIIYRLVQPAAFGTAVVRGRLASTSRRALQRLNRVLSRGINRAKPPHARGLLNPIRRAKWPKPEIRRRRVVRFPKGTRLPRRVPLPPPRKKKK